MRKSTKTNNVILGLMMSMKTMMNMINRNGSITEPN